MIKSDLYPELEQIAKKSSYEQIFKVLYTLAQFRYATFKQLHQLNHRVATKTNLVTLADLGYISQTKNLQAYFTTPKAWNILKYEGYNTDIIHKSLDAEEAEHELDVTDVLLKIYKEPDFFTIFHANFGDLVPDAVVIFKREDAYRILFVEVENPKWEWEDYLRKKDRQYHTLGRNKEVFTVWWTKWSKLLGLTLGTIDQFKFSYRVVKNG